MIRASALAVAWLVFAACLPVRAADASTAMPDVIVEQTINEVIDQFEARRAEFEQDRGKLFRLVEDMVVPHFAVEVIAQLVLAKHRRGASDAQISAFAEEFKTSLIRDYATMLFEYTGQESMEVRPLRMKEGENRAKVETLVRLSGDAPPVPVNYSFMLTDGGEWKIWDVTIDGISLITNKRNEYAQYLSSKDLDSLIEELAAKNATTGQGT